MLKQLSEDISKYEALIGQLQIDISDNERDKEITVELISEKEDSLDKALTNFDNLEAAFAETSEVFEEKIEASRKLKSILGNILQICLDKMEGATPSFIEIKKNPEFKKYFSLVQIFLQFNPETMAKLIEKLNAIIAGITESINTDETYIANMRSKYETIMGNLKSTIVLLTEELDALNLHKDDLIQKLTTEYQDLASDESILQQNKEQKAELEVLMERYLIKYMEDKKARAEAVELIMKAIPIVQDKIIGKA